MKVEIKLQPELNVPFAVIHTGKVTAEVQRVAALLSEERASLISAGEDEKIVMLHPEEIYLVRVEAEKAVIYGEKRQFRSGKRLYELEALLGPDFMRISKSTILGGVMVLVMKNGQRDYISRKYLPAFKRYLGI